jgi:3-oxoacyl-[acyl-carrier protein] reductase
VWDFGGSSALVTGACGAIGKAIAKAFAGAGANTLLVDLDDERLQALASELSSGTVRSVWAKADVSRDQEVARAFDLAARSFGTIDCVVTCAGMYRDEPFASLTSAQWRQTIAVNLDSAFQTIRQALPLLGKGGSIVNVASMAGHRGGRPGHVHYGAAKGGILALTRGLARELAPTIRVNAVSPGIIDTPMVATVLEQERDGILAGTPLGRLGTPEDVAQVVLFLASDAAGFITGETIHVNGGLHMG